MPVVLVDDHPIVRDGLAYLLAEQPDFVVVGEAEDPETALDVVERTSPSVVVLDLNLQGREAIPLLASLRNRWPRLRILILSMHDEDLYAERLLALGAHGYVMKQEEPAEFLRARSPIFRLAWISPAGRSVSGRCPGCGARSLSGRLAPG